MRPAVPLGDGSRRGGRWLTLSYDHPGSTPPDHLRFEAGGDVLGSTPPGRGIGFRLSAAGDYAMGTLHGPHEGMAPAHRHRFEEGLPNVGEGAGRTPCMEICRTPPDTPKSRPVTEPGRPLHPVDPHGAHRGCDERSASGRAARGNPSLRREDRSRFDPSARSDAGGHPCRASVRFPSRGPTNPKRSHACCCDAIGVSIAARVDAFESAI